MTKKILPHVCVGVTKLFGDILFLVTSIPIVYMLISYWHIKIDEVMSIKMLSWPLIKAVGLAFLVGLIALKLGHKLGSKIKIKNTKTASRITMYWHYVTKGTMLWLILAFGIVSWTIHLKKGDLGSFKFLELKDLIFLTLTIGVISSISVVLLKDSIRLFSDNFSIVKMLWMHVIPIAICTFTACINFGLVYDIPVALWSGSGLLFPNLLMFYADYLSRRDMRVRGLYV